MKKIEKKVWPEYFEAIVAGKKTFELRLADFEIHKGDTLILREWNPKTKSYTGRSIEKKVGYILKFHPDTLPFYSKEDVERDGLQIISFP